MLYRILKFIIGVGIRLYYKEIKIHGKKNLADNGPLIVIANHPNTLMDAWVVGMLCNQPIYYMAKATLFNSKFKLKLLRGLNMIPINRAGEGKIKGVDNSHSFAECFKKLEEGKTLVIFPEGTSYQERILRELKTGTARIALDTELRNKGKLGLKIVAVGINYSQPEKFRSNILVNIDAPAGVEDLIDDYALDSKKTARKLTDIFRLRLEKVLVTTEDKEEDYLVEELHDLLHSKYIKGKPRGVEGEVDLMKEITDSLTEIKVTQPWLIQDLNSRIASIKWRLQKLDIRADFLDRKFKSTMFFRQVILAIIFLLLALPVFIYGLIHNLIQFLFTDWLVPKLTKDVEYYAPFAIFIGLFLYPLFYCLFLVAAHKLLGWEWIGLPLYFISMPISGLFSYWFNKYLKHISYKWKYMLLMIDKNVAVEELKKDKDALRELLFNK